MGVLAADVFGVLGVALGARTEDGHVDVDEEFAVVRLVGAGAVRPPAPNGSM